MTVAARLCGSFIVVVICLLSPSLNLQAAAKPTLSLLYGWSDIVVVGRLLKVQKGGEGSRVFISISDVVKGSYEVRKLRKLSFLYPKLDRPGIDFSKLRREGADHIIFLRLSPSDYLDARNISVFNLQLTDDWYGIDKANPSIIAELKEFDQKLFGFVPSQ